MSYQTLDTIKKEGGLGFSDLKAFNLTSLANMDGNCKRVRTPQSTRYFRLDVSPMGIFFQPSWGITHPTHGGVYWLHRMLFNKVVIGRWVMDNQLIYRKISGYTNPLLDANVSLLIDPHTWAWRLDMIRKFFSLDDALAIMGIPLSSRLHKKGISRSRVHIR